MRIFLSIILILSVTGRISAQSFSKKRIEETVKQWNDAHNNWDLEKFRDLFADTVLYYGEKLDAQSCISKKEIFFLPTEIFEQKIVSEIEIEPFIENVYKCSFTKAVTFKNKTKKYPAYILVNTSTNDYFISGESDEFADSNLHPHFDVKTMRFLSAKKRVKPSLLSLVVIIVTIGTITGALIFKARKESRRRG